MGISEGMEAIEAELQPGCNDHGKARADGRDSAEERGGAYDAVVLWDLPNKERNDLLKLCYWNTGNGD